MAGRTASSITKHAYRLFNPRAGPTEPNRPVQDEFDESDIWGSPVQLPPANQVRSIPTGRFSRKKPDQTNQQTGPCSLPVNIPDWSKILGAEAHGGNNSFADNYQFWDEEVDRVGSLIPPHEFLTVNRAIPTSSVQEGIGRTLKGRDLRRVRDAVWERTGFEA